MKIEEIKQQIDIQLEKLKRAQSASSHDDLSGGLSNIELGQIRTSMEACIERLAPRGSVYLKRSREIKLPWHGPAVVLLGGILLALREDYDSGYLESVKEIIHSELLDDFLEMASELHSKGYEIPAAVLAGSVIEEHVRKLCQKADISTDNDKGHPKKFDLLTSELVKGEIISEPQKKIIAGWYAQRSEAAHGRHENVIKLEVKHMIAGIRDFMVRHPA